MDEWVWSNGGVILTGENWSTGRKTLYSVGGRWMNEYRAMVEWYWQGKLKYWEKNIIQRWCRWMNEYGAMVEWYWQGKLKYWEINLSELYFVHNKTDVDWQPGFEQSVRGERLVTDCRGWGTAPVSYIIFVLCVCFVISLIIRLFLF